MRRCEIFRLQDRDFDFRQGLITLRSPKGGKTVSIPLNPVAAEIIEEQIAHRGVRHPDSEYVFPGKKGQQRTECKSAYRIREKAGLDGFRIFHGLRHHFAVTLANSGEFGLDMIGELLTHKSPAMTKRYAQYLPDTMKKASARARVRLQGGSQEEEEPAKVVNIDQAKGKGS
ncbi:MAG: site-specific integrase [Desulfovermiculus sp.]|nr:site-specific integrase [Desulfovermiculus sp.]